jgi:hypothetical protein
MLNRGYPVHQQRANFALGNQDQATTEKLLLKSMDFSHALKHTSKCFEQLFTASNEKFS